MSTLNAPVSMRQLIYFTVVAESRSFRRAAEKLHMSQPPLTQQMQALERVLGTELFDRSRRRIELTTAGVEFLEHISGIISTMNRSFERTRAVGRGIRGTIRLGLTDDFIHGPVFSQVLAFARENREVIIETHVEVSTTLYAQLLQNELDLILTNRIARVDDGTIKERPLPSSRIMAVMPKLHRLAKRKSIRATDLANESLVHTPDDSRLPFARQCARIFDEAKVHPRVAYHTTNAALATRLAAEGLGIALVSEHSVGPDSGGLACRPIESAIRLEHVLLHQDRRLAPVLDRLIATLLVSAV